MSLLAAALVLYPAPGPVPERAVALLSSNTVVLLTLPSGHVTARRSVGSRVPSARTWAGRILARSDTRIFVLSVGAVDSVAVLSARTGQLAARWRLEPDVQYRGLVYAADRIFACGGRFGREIDTTNHVREESSVVTQLDAVNGTIIDTAELRRGDGHAWWIYWGAADPLQLALSYDGGCYSEAVQLCTSGADTIDITGDRLKRCDELPSQPNLACLQQAHGMVEPHGAGWIAATGGEQLVEFGHDGRVLRRLHSGIRKDHLMNLAFTRDRSGILVIRSCGGGRGLRRISLRTGRSTPVREGVCGAAVVPGRRALLIRKDDSIQICTRTCRTKFLGGEILDLIVTG